MAKSDNVFPDIWGAVRRELIVRFPALKEHGTQFQFVNNATVANWDNDTAYNTSVIADTAPLALGQFYSPGSSTISGSYGAFLDSLKHADNPTIISAKAAFASPGNWQSVVMPDAGGTKHVPNITISPSLNAKLPLWRTMKAPGIDLKIASSAVDTRSPPLVAASASTATVSRIQREEISVTAPAVPFFRKLARTQPPVSSKPPLSSAAPPDAPTTAPSMAPMAENRVMREETPVPDAVSALETKLNEVRFSFVALEAFQIGRGNWWSGTTVRLNRRGPYVHAGYLKEFFGKRGMLKLLPQEIIVSFRASLVVTISNANYQTHQQDIHDVNGVAVGPWVLGGAGNVMAEPVGAKMTQVTMLSKDKYSPYVVGILSNDYVL